VLWPQNDKGGMNLKEEKDKSIMRGSQGVCKMDEDWPDYTFVWGNSTVSQFTD